MKIFIETADSLAHVPEGAVPMLRNHVLEQNQLGESGPIISREQYQGFEFGALKIYIIQMVVA